MNKKIVQSSIGCLVLFVATAYASVTSNIPSCGQTNVIDGQYYTCPTTIDFSTLKNNGQCTLAGKVWSVSKEGKESLSFQRASYDKEHGVSCHYSSVNAIQSSAFRNYGILGEDQIIWNALYCPTPELCNFSENGQ